MFDLVSFKCQFACYRVSARMKAIPQRHFKAGATVAGYEEAVTPRLHIILEQVYHTAMRHYFGDMLFMVSAVGLFCNPKLRAGCGRPVLQLVVAVRRRWRRWQIRAGCAGVRGGGG